MYSNIVLNVIVVYPSCVAWRAFCVVGCIVVDQRCSTSFLRWMMTATQHSTLQ